MICINCPKGCRLEVTQTNGQWIVTGNDCPRGSEYGIQETSAPMRVLTVLMRPDGASRPVSVKTDKPIPKDMLIECAKAIYKIHPSLPIKAGDILAKDICGTGADVIATRGLE